MFTGIVTAMGHVLEVHGSRGEAAGKSVVVAAPEGYLEGVVPGDSIAVNGACMTVTTLDLEMGHFGFDVSAESLLRTSGLDQVSKAVNLEQALRLQDRLGGHLVTGHIDDTGEVLTASRHAESLQLELLIPHALGKYLARKGSVAVDGVSLTVNTVSDGIHGSVVSINLVPHTQQHTTLGAVQAGQRVNIEIDLMARYLERMVQS